MDTGHQIFGPGAISSIWTFSRERGRPLPPSTMALRLRPSRVHWFTSLAVLQRYALACSKKQAEMKVQLASTHLYLKTTQTKYVASKRRLLAAAAAAGVSVAFGSPLGGVLFGLEGEQPSSTPQFKPDPHPCSQSSIPSQMKQKSCGKASWLLLSLPWLFSG